MRIKPAVGPGQLFDKLEILDESTLEISIVRDEIIESSVRPGVNIRLIHLAFTSQLWHGYVWRHSAHLYLPEEYQPDGNVGIMGVNWQFFEEGYERARKPVLERKQNLRKVPRWTFRFLF
jgi:hypothetical protein